MSELVLSLEKSIEFLRGRYPDGNPLLTCLEQQLAHLLDRKAKTADAAFRVDVPEGTKCCAQLQSCAFFEALQHIDEISDVLQEFVTVYCCGPATERCYRLKHLREHGHPAADHVSPTGDDYFKYL